MNARFILTLALAVPVLQGPVARADTFQSKGDGVTRVWDAAASWTRTSGTTNTYPQSGDTATVLKSDVIYVAGNTQVVAHLTIEKGDAGNAAAVLELRSGGRLNVESSLNAQTDATYPADVRFATGSGANRPTLSSAGDVTISGLVQSIGSAEGLLSSSSLNRFTLSSGARIVADGGDVTISALVSVNGGAELLARGADLIVTEQVTINGTARATSSADLIFTTNAPAASSAGLIHVDSADAQVFFNAGSGQVFTGGLDFRAEAGEIVFNDTVETAGGLRIDPGGKMTIAASESFKKTGVF
jgi:hypothetical protein